MNKNNILAALRGNAVSRRDAMKALGAMGITVAALPGAAGRALAQSERGTYFTWGGYDDEGLFQPFIAKHGEAPNFVTYGDAEEGFTKMKAGFVVDVVHPCANDVPRWKNSGMFRAIDTTKLSNFPGVFDKLATLPGARDDSGQWFVPFEWGATSITYRTDLVDLEGEPESWNMLFDERFKGKVAVIDSAADTWWCIAILAGVDITKPLTDEGIEKTSELMRKLHPQIRIYTNDMTSLAQSIASGEVAMAITWNEVPVQLAGEGVPVKFAAPSEGALTWTCGVMMHKDAPNPDEAHDIIDSMLAPETGKYVIEEYGYGHSNAKSFDLVDKETLANLGLDVDPTDYVNAGKFISPQTDEVETRLNRDFEAIKTGF
ncbi:MAG: extracellular solute-binding protein [Proteobacteria bacterium]|nr:MAG: extracellular solute-binding protein [Pseudomonadota bacterium]